MPNHKSILILRSSKGYDITLISLEDGQPYYNKDNKQLYIGDNTQEDLMPVGASNLIPGLMLGGVTNITAEGKLNTVTNIASLAIGEKNTIQSKRSIAFGSGNLILYDETVENAGGSNNFVSGADNIVIGSTGITVGNSNKLGSIAGGDYTVKIKEDGSTATVSVGTNRSVNCAIFGNQNTIMGARACQVSGENNTIVDSIGSFIAGTTNLIYRSDDEAGLDYAMLIGNGLRATNRNQMIVGRSNDIEDSKNKYFIVAHHKNLFTVGSRVESNALFLANEGMSVTGPFSCSETATSKNVTVTLRLVTPSLTSDLNRVEIDSSHAFNTYGVANLLGTTINIGRDTGQATSLNIKALTTTKANGRFETMAAFNAYGICNFLGSTINFGKSNGSSIVSIVLLPGTNIYLKGNTYLESKNKDDPYSLVCRRDLSWETSGITANSSNSQDTALSKIVMADGTITTCEYIDTIAKAKQLAQDTVLNLGMRYFIDDREISASASRKVRFNGDGSAEYLYGRIGGDSYPTIETYPLWMMLKCASTFKPLRNITSEEEIIELEVDTPSVFGIMAELPGSPEVYFPVRIEIPTTSRGISIKASSAMIYAASNYDDSTGITGVTIYVWDGMDIWKYGHTNYGTSGYFAKIRISNSSGRNIQLIDLA